MPQVVNPYYTPPTDQITPAMANVMKAFLSAPGPYERDLARAKTDAAAALALKNQADAAQTAQQMQAPANIAGVYDKFFTKAPPEAARPDSGFTGPMPQQDVSSYRRQALGPLAQYGAQAKITPQGVADLFRFFQANAGAPRADVASSRSE